MHPNPFLSSCVAIDLEVDRGSGEIRRFAAVRGGADGTALSPTRVDAAALQALDAFADGARHLVGHNLLAFDLPHLHARAPKLGLLQLPCLDTLRLSPLAFPRNPYHRLVKHYKNGALLREHRNNPELDARLCLRLLEEEFAAVSTLAGEGSPLPLLWHGLCGGGRDDAGFADFFAATRRAVSPEPAELHASLHNVLRGVACPKRAERISASGWPLAYALAWISVAEGNSVMPPWVRHQFPEAAEIVRQIRDTPCGDADCPWCGERHDVVRALRRHFGHGAFRPEPALPDGRPVQQVITESAMRGQHVLGILPTGTGKSVCYQVPALCRHANTGALTVVISPLVALMEDQVRGLAAAGHAGCAALNGLLSMPGRADVLDRVRLGDIAILLVSPEQLRNRGFRRAVEQREIGAWVLDEAHCLSKWGHDFRTDYRYVGRFIREHAGTSPLPPVLCLTATAKPEVVADIVAYFETWLKADITVFNGGSRRDNLEFQVVATDLAHKERDIDHVLRETLTPGGTGGAIVYAAYRAGTEVIAQKLRDYGWSAEHFHAGLSPERKKQTQAQFLDGETQVIVATNAFGMGIDKPDVRVVLHADIPGSLENYVQEAGRAGRDQKHAKSVLLYCEQDVEKQFELQSLHRLSQAEIQRILRAVRRLAGKRRHRSDEVELVVTPGEILAEEPREDRPAERDSAESRVRTAIAWLEHAQLLLREENRYEVFPSTLRIGTLEDADRRLAHLPADQRAALRAIVGMLLHAEPSESISTDDIMGATALNAQGVVAALRTLERLGLMSDDAIITALVHHGVPRASRKRLAEIRDLERSTLDLLEAAAPDFEAGESANLHLRQVTQALKDQGHPEALPERVLRILQGVATDGRSEGQGRGSLRLRRRDGENVHVTLQRNWSDLRETAALRGEAAAALLSHLLAQLPPGQSGVDLQVDTTLGKLLAVLEQDLGLAGRMAHPTKLLERALLWMHEQEVLRLGKGLVIFSGAMTLKVPATGAPFTKEDFAELQAHYEEQCVQVHIMSEYARRGLEEIRASLRLVEDYFTRQREDFLRQWFPGRRQELTRPTTVTSWRKILETLSPAQREHVEFKRRHENRLVLAGPGSGKTRVLVHRIAYIVRVLQEPPRTIVALAYNRHAAWEIRGRLRELLGDAARQVTVLTCHGLAMRLTGASFEQAAREEMDFERVLSEATALLRGDGLPPDDADGQRDRLLAGFHWILVDEYQDVDAGCYELISALAGRSLQNPENRLSLFAVGDDDQNIYAFKGSSTEYIRRFQADYLAKPGYLVENYRSSGHIVAVANAVIGEAQGRMKADAPIRVDDHRAQVPPGGAWSTRDPVGMGRVQILRTGGAGAGAAHAAMEELRRLSGLAPDWDWPRVAVIARTWSALHPVRAYCEHHGIPTQWGRAAEVPVWMLRETRELVAWLRREDPGMVTRDALDTWLTAQAAGRWWDLLRGAVEEFWGEQGTGAVPASHLREWLAEWCREARGAPNGLQLLTAHGAKGLEFDHVALLDDGWDSQRAGEAPDAERRLYYVAMTRARETLTLVCGGVESRFIAGLPSGGSVLRRDFTPPQPMPTELNRIYVYPALDEVDLGFAGRRDASAPVHRALGALQAGDPLALSRIGEEWRLLNTEGRVVGRMAKKFAPPRGMTCRHASVHAMLVREATQNRPQFQDACRCTQWEVVVPAFVFGRGKSS